MKIAKILFAIAVIVMLALNILLTTTVLTQQHRIKYDYLYPIKNGRGLYE